jgi:hypothetical protein
MAMPLYKCPSCGKVTVSWDPRAGSFLCNDQECNSWFEPPTAEELGLKIKEDVATAISRGQIKVQQEWFDHKPCEKT